MMSVGLSPVLLINGLTLALALAFLMIILWYDVRRTLNQFFAIFLFLVGLWNAGYLALQVGRLLGDDALLESVSTG
ncbi:MAG: hypothetical protein ACPG7F_19980, partial [Aggregatilineales bacterium]